MFYHNYHRKLALIAIFFCFFTKNAICWNGIDLKNNTEIEIGSGNLVRENLIITIFDWKSNKYHDVEILEMESSFNSTTLKVFDLEINQKRIFEME
jgi:hypothetical protein